MGTAKSVSESSAVFIKHFIATLQLSMEQMIWFLYLRALRGIFKQNMHCFLSLVERI